VSITSVQSPQTVVSRPAPYPRILITGIVFGVLAAIPVSVLYWILRLLGVPFEAQQTFGSSDAPVTLIGWWQVVMACVVAGLLAAVVAGVFRTLVSGPRIAAIALAAITLASCAGVVMQPATVPWSTRLSLIVLHLLVGGILTWSLARSITSEDPPPGVVAELDARHPGAGQR